MMTGLWRQRSKLCKKMRFRRLLIMMCNNFMEMIWMNSTVKKKHIKKGQLAGLIEALGVIAATIGVTIDDDSLDFLDDGSTD
ncbi:hypothetical protein ES319_A07G143000v1 [Gossypium barbadense]|uniref:Uncharacterized protein n=2 Tax=Gossypium TaxID=3633 RepID=A0A5J5V3M3_GOSBA|nr:hypothetical protein ES319_A07G143000v1 [Gossypium barbadense]TYH10115.1 hypothetical protein ES288_A07G152800v1 [Gossypium darwinii]